MPMFLVETTVPCFVTWRTEIEADTEAEAIEQAKLGFGSENEDEPIIGDAVDGAVAEYSICPSLFHD